MCRTLGEALTGGSSAYTGSSLSTRLKVSGVDVFSAGKHAGGPGCEDIVFRDAGRGVYKRIVLEGGKVAGAVLFGDAADGGWYFDLMKSGEDVSDFRETLVFGQAATEGLRGLDPSAAVAAMADTAEVCGCNGVCKGQIVSAIHDQGLTTLDSVRAVTKASASCGTCTPLVEKILKLSLGDAFQAQTGPKPVCGCTRHGHDHVRRVIVERAGPRGFIVRGSVPVGVGPSYQAYEVSEPADYARALLIESLRRRGVAVQASPLGHNEPVGLPPREAVATLPKLAQYTSPPLREYLKVILKVSHNLHASTLPLLLAAGAGQRTLDQGLAIEGRLIKELGVDLASVSFGGGAGGSPSDLVTPRATVTLLRAMSARPDFPAFEGALPILGRDGTLAQAVGPDSPARGHVRAKTGTFTVRDALTDSHILTSKALAGYMETASGRRLTFAFFLNDVPLDPNVSLDDATAAAGRLLGRLCEAVYADQPPAKEARSDTPKPARPAADGPAATGDTKPGTPASDDAP